MANEVKNLLYDVGLLLGNPNLADPQNPVAVLRIMNHHYRNINADLKCCEKKLALAAGTFSSSIYYYTIPSDMIEIFNIIPGETTLYGLDFVPKERWNINQYQNHDTFTILNGRLEFGNVDANTALDIYYYSAGLELVNKADADVTAATEVNTPEWQKRFWRLLVYLTCMELKPEYEFFAYWARAAEALKAELAAANRNKQSITPTVMGGANQFQAKLDPDYVNGMWVTRRSL